MNMKCKLFLRDSKEALKGIGGISVIVLGWCFVIGVLVVMLMLMMLFLGGVVAALLNVPLTDLVFVSFAAYMLLIWSTIAFGSSIAGICIKRKAYRYYKQLQCRSALAEFYNRILT